MPKRNSSPLAADASTTRPARKVRRTPWTSLPPCTAGKSKQTVPSVASSMGPVKTSPSGKFSCPSQLIQVRPAVPTLRSVPFGEMKRSLRILCKKLTTPARSEEHTSELQSHLNLVCRLLLEKKKKLNTRTS